MFSTLKGRDVTVAALAVAAVVSGGYCALKWQQKRRDVPPSEDKWRKVGTLSDLVCYPIKSCGYIRQKTMQCSILGVSNGFLRDRVFLIVNADKGFETARAHPHLVLIQPKIEENYLILTGPKMEDLKICISSLVEDGHATIYKNKVPVADCGDEAAEWISRYIERPGEGYRLVYYPQTISHRVNLEEDIYPLIKTEDGGAFGDLTSYNLMNEASVADMNARMVARGSEPVDIHVFRGTFIVDCKVPYAEDNWKWVKIGNIIFKVIAPCMRCLMVTINNDKGTRSMDREPLITLKTYRCIDGPTPTLGIHMNVLEEGPVSMGDDVYAA